MNITESRAVRVAAMRAARRRGRRMMIVFATVPFVLLAIMHLVVLVKG